MYIGKTPTVGNFQKCDALTTSATADYTLQVSSVNVSPESVNHMIVSLNGVIQAPTTAYTVSGATLSFASALTSADVIDFVLLLGNVLDVGTPTDNTVATAKIQDDAVTLAKMAAGTDGNIISYDASGNPVAIATGTSGHFLKSQGAGAQPVFAAAGAVLQVKAKEFTGTASNTSATPAALTDFNIAFTPTSASSKLFLQVSLIVGAPSTGVAGYFYDSTGGAIIGAIGAAASSRGRYNFGAFTTSSVGKFTVGASAWFTPGDTTARTLQVFASAQTTNTLYINRNVTDTDDATINHSRLASTFTITEFDGSIVTIA